MKRLFWISALVLTVAGAAFAQPRPVEKGKASESAKSAAPTAVEAKYEGGMFGFNDKESGMLKFDDANNRLVFYGKDQRESFSIPYAALLVIYPQSRSVSSTAGTVVSHIPLPGAGLAGLIREKRRYLILHFDDPDVDAKGVISFKLEDKETLDSVIQTLGGKANLTQRGDAFYRPRAVKGEI